MNKLVWTEEICGLVRNLMKVPANLMKVLFCFFLLLFLLLFGNKLVWMEEICGLVRNLMMKVPANFMKVFAFFWFCVLLFVFCFLCFAFCFAFRFAFGERM